MKDILLIGGGSHCRSVIDTLTEKPEWNIVGVLDIKEKVGTVINGVKIIGEDHELQYFYKEGIRNAFITAGGIGDNSLRIKLFKLAKDTGYELPFIIDPTAIVSNTANVAEGSFIGKGVILNTDVRVGKNCIINTGVIIDHDGNIHDHCHLAPGTTLSGGVQIGEASHIGTNSTIIQNIKVGKNTLIGAGSVVVKNVGNNQKAFGNPCKVV